MATENSGPYRRHVEPGSPEFQDFLKSIRNSYLDNHYKTRLQFCELYFINNDNLQQRFDSRREKLVATGGKELSDEIMAFACFKKAESVNKIIQDGAEAKTGIFNYLGSSDLGVNLCRHADIQLKSAEAGRDDVTKCWMVVFKVLPGRSWAVVADESVYFPTVGFDSHVSKLIPTAGYSLVQQIIHSQMYLYEFTGPGDSDLSRYPSNVLPYAVLTFIKPTARARPSAASTRDQARLNARLLLSKRL